MNLIEGFEKYGTEREKKVWLKLKNFFKFLYDDTCNEYEFNGDVYSSKNKTIYKNDNLYYQNSDFAFNNDLFKKNLLIYYDQDELKFCKKSVKINSTPQPYCDQRFIICRFEKEKYILSDIMHTFLLDYGFGDMKYKQYVQSKNRFKNRSKNILDAFMSDFNDNIITNKNGEFEEFCDIIILEDDGNDYNLICENSDYYYFFNWSGS